MRIGVDIDGVLTEQVYVLWEMGAKFCAEKGWKCRIDPTAVSKEKMFGIDGAAWLEMWCKYAKSWMLDLPIRTCAAEVIGKLRDEGHEIWIVTARSDTDPRFDGLREDESFREATERWLRENGIVYDRMAFATRDKGKFCRKNGIEVMIEDDPRYLETFDTERQRVLIFDQPYNQGVKMKNGVRVCAWYEVYEWVQELVTKEGGEE